MRVKSLFMALLGMAVAGGSVYAARQYISLESEALRAESESQIVRVLAAAREIPYSVAIESHMVTSIPWPRDAVPPGAFTNFDELVAARREDARRAKQVMAQGEIILASKVSDFGEKVTIVQKIKDGHRAVAINVNATTSAGGFVTPGDKVDILMTQGNGDNLASYTILQSILIIGVDQNANEQSDAPQVARTVTVEVTPEQSQKLALAQRAGQLSLSLRSLENEEDKPLESVRLVDILNSKSPIEEDAPKSIVRVRRGTGDAEDVTLRSEAVN